jgi:hypothetical protein
MTRRVVFGLLRKQRKSVAASKKSTTTRRKAGGPRAGEVVLLTCSPLLSEGVMQQLASTCLGKIGENADGYQRIIGVRVDVSSHTIYAKLEPTIESAYIFAPAHLFAEERKRG